jgi:hypothetical protein
VAFAAALACLPDLVAAPVNTYASAIALEELAKAATAEAYSLHRFSTCRLTVECPNRATTFCAQIFEIEIAAADALSNRREEFNGLKKRLYLSSDPWGPFRRLFVFAGCC